MSSPGIGDGFKVEAPRCCGWEHENMQMWKGGQMWWGVVSPADNLPGGLGGADVQNPLRRTAKSYF